jgi:hypothetical protein
MLLRIREKKNLANMEMKSADMVTWRWLLLHGKVISLVILYVGRDKLLPVEAFNTEFRFVYHCVFKLEFKYRWMDRWKLLLAAM